MSERLFRQRAPGRTGQAALPAPGRQIAAVVVSGRQALAASSAQEWGRFPLLTLSSATGLLMVVVAYAYSRMGDLSVAMLFWGGLLVLLAPIAARLIAPAPARRERIALVVLLGLSLYLVKVVHSPFDFTFSDELIHIHNVDDILRDRALFGENPILPVTPLYPGLEIVTAALTALSGLSAFHAGLIVVGAARTIMMLALFLFYEQVSGSARVAGVSTAIYVGAPNYVFWGVQFSYESLALPLATVVLYALVRRSTVQDQQHAGLSLILVMTVLAIVITHHMSSYALTIFLIALTILCAVHRRLYGAPQPRVAHVAALALVATLVWLTFVASLTIGYLSPVLSRAIQSVFRMIVQEESGRQLFQSSSGVLAPLWERAVGIGSVLLLLLGLPFGLLQVWRRHRQSALAVLLAGGALAYFGTLAMRLTSAGWETGNRASSFLFVGLAFTVGLGMVDFWRRQWQVRLVRTVFPIFLSVVLFGGIIAGWVPGLRLARPLVVQAGDHTVESQGVATARWFRANLGPERTVGADPSNAVLLLRYGDQNVGRGRAPEIKHLLLEPDFSDWQWDTLEKLSYLVVDRRHVSWDAMRGLYFDRLVEGDLLPEGLIRGEVLLKFDRVEGAMRIFDSGNIVVYGVSRVERAP